MLILGLNAFHGDASACIFKDGKLVVAAEEERFSRIKHSAGFPLKSIEFCLKKLNINLDQVDYITINRNPKLRVVKKIIYAIKNVFKLKKINDRYNNFKKINSLEIQFEKYFDINPKIFKNKIVHVDHHLAHAASSVIPSKFSECNFVTVDGFGDFVSTTMGYFKNNHFKVLKEVLFPHSLGLFYTAMTQYLGFKNYGDEYKVMGLSPYGKPKYLNELKKVVYYDEKSLFLLNLKYFSHHTKGIEMSWLDGEPKFGDVFSESLLDLLGKEREKNEELTQKHKDIASSTQKIYEEIFINIINQLYKINPSENLCVSGGCAMNSVANGKIKFNTKYNNIYINYAPGDSGGSIGSSLFHLNNKVKFNYETLRRPYVGNTENEKIIEELLGFNKILLDRSNIKVEKFSELNKLIEKIALKLSEGSVVGCFNGQMEFGPRALGNRSILADPRNKNMKDILNYKIKRREGFRPFAPSILEEEVSNWFDVEDHVPYMSKVYNFKKNKTGLVPAVVHVDGSGRLQTVSRTENSFFYNLIKEFYKITAVPILLNTSFNENEPIVSNSKQALDCFIRTKMDILILENYVISR
ncbi:carbamoyltransferase [Candidatus Pelagibacter sp.]|nr:carbamoyltransferase [Candidatus Pelagibacter sp.]